MHLLKLAVTGNIATGKSFVGDILEKLGCPVIDSDRIVHQILATPNPQTQELIRLCVPTEIRAEPDESFFIDRRKLGVLVFSDARLRQSVEQVLHPEVARHTAQFFAECAERGQRVAANLIPLLFETGAERNYDRVWLVYCDPVIQRLRLRQRNPQLTEEELDRRICSQMPQSVKIKLADQVIDNSGDPELTEKRIIDLWRALSIS